ncbi:Activating signal cointegrator 1 [Homalodisca vitripennis]|nr:Activating signal cointegrator 1 [Homalodisca vitripennis]
MSDEWLYEQLSDLLQFPVPQEMIDYIKSIVNMRDLEDYIRTLLDFDNPQHKRFLQELIQRRKELLKTTDQVLLGKFAILQTTKDGIPLPCYSKEVKEQVFSSFLLLVTHSTERILPKDTDSVKMFPQVTISPITQEDTNLLSKFLGVSDPISLNQDDNSAVPPAAAQGRPKSHLLKTPPGHSPNAE